MKYKEENVYDHVSTPKRNVLLKLRHARKQSEESPLKFLTCFKQKNLDINLPAYIEHNLGPCSGVVLTTKKVSLSYVPIILTWRTYLKHWIKMSITWQRKFALTHLRDSFKQKKEYSEVPPSQHESPRECWKTSENISCKNEMRITWHLMFVWNLICSKYTQIMSGGDKRPTQYLKVSE